MAGFGNLAPGFEDEDTLLSEAQRPPPVPADIDWSRLNQPLGELKPSDRPPSERVTGAIQDALMAGGAQPYTAGHLARGLSGIAGWTPAAIPMSAADFAYYKNRGDLGGSVMAAAGLIPGAKPEVKAAEELAAPVARKFASWADALTGKEASAPPPINWVRDRVGLGGVPIGADRTVVDVNVNALDRAHRATDPEMALEKPKQQVIDHMTSGNPISLPEVGVVNGRLGFDNGRNRVAVAKMLGHDTVPVVVEKGNLQELQDLLAKHSGEQYAPEAAGRAGAEAGVATAPGPLREDVTGGDGGRAARVGAAQAQAKGAAGPYAALEGLPQKPLEVGNDLFIPGPIGKVKDTAAQYMRDRPIPSFHREPTQYHPLDPEHSANIAQAFEEMKHEPDNPAVKASYEALIKETRDQYRAIRTNHPDLQIVPNAPGQDPYAATPRLAAKDVIENNRLHFFPTEQGYGTGEQGGIDMATHPMMQPSGETLNGKPLLNNDLFRIVHDYFGHLKEGYGFRAAGEDNAWRSHASMYSDLARPAMTTETRGQNSWVNFGPHAEANKGASAGDTIYAPQKAGLMPEWTMRDRNSPAPIVVYQGSPHAFSQQDISKIGAGEGNQVFGHGLYFAEHSPVSEWYRHQLAVRHDPLLKKYKLDPDHGSRMGVDIANSKGDTAPVIADLQDHIENLKAKQAEGDTSMMTKNQIKNSTNMIRYMNDPNRAKGHLYQVAIDRPDEHFLHWDKPLNQQSEYVQSKMRPILDTLTPKMKDARARLLAKAQEQMARAPSGVLQQKLEGDIRRYSQPVTWENTPGSKLYAHAAHAALGKPPLNAPEAYPIATQYLRAKGIAGIKYLDQHSRMVPEAQGTHNYVTFDAPRILKRYALPGLLGGGALGGLAMPQGGEDGS